VFIATANADSSTGRVEARAGLGEAAMGKEDGMKVHGKMLTVGAEAQLNPEYTGVGVQATFAEAGAEFKNVGGFKMGISGDTAVGAGSKGLTAKVIGTGIKADETGVEVTVLGTGVKLGSWASPWAWFD